MEITLRKAKALQVEIKHKLDEILPKGGFRIDEFSKKSIVHEASDKFDFNLRLSLLLIEVLYEIRNDTAIKNVECGVSSQLTLLAEVEAKLTLFNSVGLEQRLEADEVIHNKLARLMDGIPAEFSRTQKAMVVGVVKDEHAEATLEALSTYKKERVAIVDQLAELNALNKITLTNETVEVLKEADII